MQKISRLMLCMFLGMTEGKRTIMKRLGLLFLLFLSPALGLTDAQELSVHAVRKKSSDSGTEYLRQGKRLAEFDNNYASALHCYRKASDYFQKSQNWEKYIETLNGIGRVYNDLAEYPKSEKYLREALALTHKHLGEKHPSTAYSYAGLASVEARIQSFDSSLVHNKKALEIYTQALGPDAPEVGMVLFQLAFVYFGKFNFDKAIEYAQKSLSIRLKKLGENDSYVASAYNIIGSAYGGKGNYDKLLKYCNKGLEIRKRLFGENHRQTAISYMNLAKAYIVRRDYDRQLEYYQKVLTIYRHIFGENHYQTGDVYRVVSFVYLESGDYTKQAEYMAKAVKIILKNNGKNYPGLFYPYLNLGNAYLKLDEREKALAYYRKAYRVRDKSFDKNGAFELVPSYTVLAAHSQKEGDTKQAFFYLHKAALVLKKHGQERSALMAEVQNRQGELFLSLGEPVKALQAFQQGLIAVSDTFNSISTKDNPDLENASSKYLLLSLLANKANTLSRLGEEQTDRSYTEALNTYESAMRLLDRLRIGLNTDEFKEKITAKYAAVYEGAVETAQRLYEQTEDQKYLERAFYASERSKAFLLHEASAESRAKAFAGIPQNLLKQENELKRSISFYEDQIQQNRNLHKFELAEELQNRVLLLRQELEALIKQFEREYPQYYALKYATEPASLEQVQASLEENTVLAEYLVGERNLYVFLISREGPAFRTGKLKLIKTKKPALLAERVEAFQSSILQRDFEGYTQEAHCLYRDIFAPLLPQLAQVSAAPARLTVIPDGPLWHLNFELLLSKSAEVKDYSKLAYLLQDYTFGYAYSATLHYGNLPAYRPTFVKEQCLAFSFSGTQGSGLHAELPGSKTELQTIEKYREGIFLNGRKADESAFKRLAPECSVLHLALHGEVDDLHPERSALYFPLNDQQNIPNGEDGILHASELYNMRLNAELAVLSACKTGTGKLVKGEGILSLGRAFTYAGCKSLVMSLWEVSDATAPELMGYFYKNLSKGMSKDEALRQAKLTYLSSADNLSANPYYWGSFVMLGNESPLPQEQKKTTRQAGSRFFPTTILILGIFIVAFLSRRKKLPI